MSNNFDDLLRHELGILNKQPAALMSVVYNALAPLEPWGKVNVTPAPNGIVAYWQSNDFPNTIGITGDRSEGFTVEVTWEMNFPEANDQLALRKASEAFGRIGLPSITAVHRHIAHSGITYDYHFHLQAHVRPQTLKQALEYIVAEMPKR